MARVAAIGFVVGLVATGCHSSESCRLRQEVERLTRENAELRTETARLIKENQTLAAAAADEDDDDLDIGDIDDDDEHAAARHPRRDLMDPFPAAMSESAAQKRLEDAQQAYVHGHYDKAIELAGGLRDYQRGKALRIMGASSCFLKDVRAAKHAYRELDAQGQQFLRYVCSRNDIAL